MKPTLLHRLGFLLVSFGITTSAWAQPSALEAWKAYSQFTNQLAGARFHIAGSSEGFRYLWHTNQGLRLGFGYDEVHGLLDPQAKRIVAVSDMAASSVRRFNPGDPAKSTHSIPTQKPDEMERRAKLIANAFGWPIHEGLAARLPLPLSNRFSSAGGTWGFNWHRKVNGFRLWHEQVRVFIADKGLALEDFKSTITTNSYEFSAGPLLATNALHAAIIRHENLSHPGWLERGTPDLKLPVNLVVREMAPPLAPARELFVVEADYARRFNYPTPTKGPGGKAKEFRLAYHVYYFIVDGTPGRGEKELHRNFGCFDAITGAALLHEQ